jgi:hypothetical protein
MIKEMLMLFLRPLAFVITIYLSVFVLYTCIFKARASCVDSGGDYIRGKCYYPSPDKSGEMKWELK